jgi:hypothetical protein
MLTRKILLALLIAGAAMMPTLTPATAQPPESPGGGPGRMMGPGAMMGPGMMGRGGFGALCGPRAAGFAEWRMERIERAVRPTEAQRAALNELRAASAKAAETIAAACPSEIPLTSSGRLEFMEKRLEAMLQGGQDRSARV